MYKKVEEQNCRWIQGHPGDLDSTPDGQPPSLRRNGGAFHLGDSPGPPHPHWFSSRATSRGL
jgi:hypothetical protein